MGLEQKEDYELSFVLSDIHIPFEDKKSLELVLRCIEENQPDNIFLNGDVMDCMSISKFPKHPSYYKRLTDEIKLAKEFFQQLRARVKKDTRIFWIFGNHEYRLDSYILSKADELFGLYNLDELTKASSEDIEVINSGLKESFYRYGNVLIGHYNRTSKHAGFTVKLLLEEKGFNIIQGHTHRLATHYKKKADGSYLMGFENGCLCNINQHYILDPNWCQGFTVIRRQGTFQQIDPIPIINHKFYYEGKLYK